METNFFSRLSSLIDGFDLNMTFAKQGDQISVALFPKSKKDKEESFPPLVLTGSIEELDKLFFSKIEKAMVKTGEIMSTIAFYAKNMELKKQQAADKANGKKKVEEQKKDAKKNELPLSTSKTAKRQEKSEPSVEKKEEEEEEETEEKEESLFPKAEAE